MDRYTEHVKGLNQELQIARMTIDGLQKELKEKRSTERTKVADDLDWFACAALAGAMQGGSWENAEPLAKFAYDVAEAMLKERERRRG